MQLYEVKVRRKRFTVDRLYPRAGGAGRSGMFSNSAASTSGGRPALRIIMRWEKLVEDEIVRVPHHPFWMGHDNPLPPKAAVEFFKRVHGDLALAEGLRAWASKLAGIETSTMVDRIFRLRAAQMDSVGDLSGGDRENAIDAPEHHEPTPRELKAARMKDNREMAARDAAKDTQSSITKILNELNPERLPRYLQSDTWHRAGWINSIVAGLW